MTLRIEHCATTKIAPAVWAALIALCDAAYDESTAEYFRDIGPGEHLLGWHGATLASHLMWVPRQLHSPLHGILRTAYIEMVATDPARQRRGHASALLGALPAYLTGFDLAALSPATESIYHRHGWLNWDGPLSHRRNGVSHPDPDEQAMILRLPHTPASLDRSAPLSVEWRPGEVW